MDNTMVQSLVVALIRRGLKAGTILSYMSAIRPANLLRGLTAPALSDSMVQAAIRGLKKRESLVETPRAVMTLQLLKEARDKPKTARSQPTQIVELPTIDGWLCPVTVYRNWQRGRKGAVLGGTPIFTWKDGSLITLGDMNKMLGVLLAKE